MRSLKSCIFSIMIFGFNQSAVFVLILFADTIYCIW